MTAVSTVSVMSWLCQCFTERLYDGSVNSFSDELFQEVVLRHRRGLSFNYFSDFKITLHSSLFHYMSPNVLATSVSPYDAEDTEQPACMCAHAHTYTHIHTQTYPSENNTEHICVTVTPYTESQTF